MKDYFAEYHKKILAKNGFIYGTGAIKRINRKWYNPFRYLMGKETFKSIPVDIFLKVNKDSHN